MPCDAGSARLLSTPPPLVLLLALVALRTSRVQTQKPMHETNSARLTLVPLLLPVLTLVGCGAKAWIHSLSIYIYLSIYLSLHLFLSLNWITSIPRRCCACVDVDVHAYVHVFAYTGPISPAVASNGGTGASASGESSMLFTAMQYVRNTVFQAPGNAKVC